MIAPSRDALAGAVARGWCAPKNANKTMDEALAWAIVDELQALFAAPQPVDAAPAELADREALIASLENHAVALRLVNPDDEMVQVLHAVVVMMETDEVLLEDTHMVLVHRYMKDHFLASPSPAVPPEPFDRAEFIRQVVSSVAEIPDRDSPDDQPEMMLVTGGELKNIMENYFEMADEDADVAAPVAAQAAQGAVPEALAPYGWVNAGAERQHTEYATLVVGPDNPWRASANAFPVYVAAQPTDTTAGE